MQQWHFVLVYEYLKNEWFNSWGNDLTFLGLNLSKKNTISIKPHQHNVLLICSKKFHNTFLGQRTMKVSNTSEL